MLAKHELAALIGAYAGLDVACGRIGARVDVRNQRQAGQMFAPGTGRQVCRHIGVVVHVGIGQAELEQLALKQASQVKLVGVGGNLGLVCRIGLSGDAAVPDKPINHIAHTLLLLKETGRETCRARHGNLANHTTVQARWPCFEL